jgi:hypothetical protein
VNCFSSPLFSGSTLPLLSLPRVRVSILYTRIQCVRGGGVWCSGPQTDQHMPQSRVYTGQFLDDDTLHCLLCALSFYGLVDRHCPRLIPTTAIFQTPFISHCTLPLKGICSHVRCILKINCSENSVVIYSRFLHIENQT